MTEEQKIMLKNTGALSYPVESVMILLGIEDQSAFKKDFVNPNSEVFRIYKQGEFEAKYILDLKLLQMAKDGDLKAMDKIESAATRAKAQKELDARKKR